MTTTVRAIQATVLHDNGGVIAVEKGQPFPADDPLVVAHAWLFATDAERDGSDVVEAATAGPGEKRTTATRR